MLRYIERNPVRATLVPRAEQWPWSSAPLWSPEARRPSYLVAGPVARPEDCLAWINTALTAAELEAVRRSVNRGAPYGSPAWMQRTAARLGLQSTLRPRGRPRKRPVGEKDTN